MTCDNFIHTYVGAKCHSRIGINSESYFLLWSYAVSSLGYTYTKMLGYHWVMWYTMHAVPQRPLYLCRYVAGFDSVYGCGDGLLLCVLAEAVYKYFRHSTLTRQCPYQGPEWQSITSASLVASWATPPWAVRKRCPANGTLEKHWGETSRKPVLQLDK